MAWSWEKYYDPDDYNCLVHVYLIAISDLPNNANLNQVIDEITRITIKWAFKSDEVRHHADKMYGSGTGLTKRDAPWVITRTPFRVQFNHQPRTFNTIDDRDMFIAGLQSLGYMPW